MKFRGKLKSIHKELFSDNYIVSFEMEEGDLEQADKIKEAEYKAYNPDLLEVFEVLSDTFDKTVMEEYNKNKEK